MNKKIWEKVADRDIKYDSFTLFDLKNWITENVPAGTKDENIKFHINVEETPTYYDEVLIDVNMELYVKTS